MGVRHRTLGPPLGNFSRMPVSRQTPSRFGPSHCGQSSPRAAGPATIPAISMTIDENPIPCRETMLRIIASSPSSEATATCRRAISLLDALPAYPNYKRLHLLLFRKRPECQQTSQSLPLTEAI